MENYIAFYLYTYQDSVVSGFFFLSADFNVLPVYYSPSMVEKGGNDLARVHLQQPKSETLFSNYIACACTSKELGTKCFIRNVRWHWENHETQTEKLFEKQNYGMAERQRESSWAGIRVKVNKWIWGWASATECSVKTSKWENTSLNYWRKLYDCMC